MEFQDLIPWVIFVVITAMIWAMVKFFSSNPSRVTERLDELRDPTLRAAERAAAAAESGKAMAVLEKAAPTLSKALRPKTELEQNHLKVKLANAGFNSPSAPQLYLGTKVGLGVLMLALGSTFGFLKFGWSPNGMTVAAIVAAVGFYSPGIWLFMIRKARIDRIFLAMPDALDLMVVCVEAGLGLDAAMRRVAEELTDTAPDMCYEFSLANMQLQMGRSRKQVLHDLGVRSGVDDMKSLAAVLIQADKFGSSIAQALRVQSDSMRVKRRQLAEERAQQTSVKMIFPLVLFIFPGVFVVLVGPAAIMMLENLLTD
jgi:tight adherence protein C